MENGITLPAVGRLSIYDLMQLRERCSVYLEQLQRAWWREQSIFDVESVSQKKRAHAKAVFTVEIQYMELLIEKLDDLIASLRNDTVALQNSAS